MGQGIGSPTRCPCPPVYLIIYLKKFPNLQLATTLYSLHPHLHVASPRVRVVKVSNHLPDSVNGGVNGLDGDGGALVSAPPYKHVGGDDFKERKVEVSGSKRWRSGQCRLPLLPKWLR